MGSLRHNQYLGSHRIGIRIFRGGKLDVIDYNCLEKHYTCNHNDLDRI